MFYISVIRCIAAPIFAPIFPISFYRSSKFPDIYLPQFLIKVSQHVYRNERSIYLLKRIFNAANNALTS